jgi:hypothetical protein
MNYDPANGMPSDDELLRKRIQRVLEETQALIEQSRALRGAVENRLSEIQEFIAKHDARENSGSQPRQTENKSEHRGGPMDPNASAAPPTSFHSGTH